MIPDCDGINSGGRVKLIRSFVYFDPVTQLTFTTLYSSNKPARLIISSHTDYIAGCTTALQIDIGNDRIRLPARFPRARPVTRPRRIVTPGTLASRWIDTSLAQELALLRLLEDLSLNIQDGATTSTRGIRIPDADHPAMATMNPDEARRIGTMKGDMGGTEVGPPLRHLELVIGIETVPIGRAWWRTDYRCTRRNRLEGRIGREAGMQRSLERDTSDKSPSPLDEVGKNLRRRQRISSLSASTPSSQNTNSWVT